MIVKNPQNGIVSELKSCLLNMVWEKYKFLPNDLSKMWNKVPPTIWVLSVKERVALKTNYI